MDLPEPLKFIKRFLIQANQVERSKHPLIAYYLRLHAVTLAVKLPKEQRDANMQFIGHLMDELEKLKGELDALDKDSDRVRVEEFAAQLFDHADKTDRAGKATKLTALGFSAASVVFECLEYFDALEPEIVERIRYAKWKAAEISKALKNGQTPTPGPYNQPDSNEEPQPPPPSYDGPEQKNDESFMSDDRSSSITRASSQTNVSRLQALASAPSTAASTSRLSLDEEKQYYAVIMEAEKKVSQALASLRFKDWNGAESLLLSALDRVRVLKSLNP